MTATWSDFSGASPDDHVRTEYDMVRIDPLTLKLDTSDQTFATSTGTATYLGVAVTSMPLGVAMSCGHNFATAQVHLGDTPFVIENHFALRGDAIAGGNATRGRATASSRCLRTPTAARLRPTSCRRTS